MNEWMPPDEAAKAHSSSDQSAQQGHNFKKMDPKPKAATVLMQVNSSQSLKMSQ